jgi:hypothetical protein
MSSVLIVGGDRIDGIKQVLVDYGVNQINHWPGRKAGDSNKVIPQDTKAIVLVTNWISHAFTHKVKKTAIKLSFFFRGQFGIKFTLEILVLFS